MTKEEARLTLQDNFGYLSQEHPRILEALRVALDALPILPSNLDEAAEQYADYNSRRWHEDGDVYYDHSKILEAFKAGAEWMAGQGWIDDGSMPPETKYEEDTMQGHREWTGSEPLVNGILQKDGSYKWCLYLDGYKIEISDLEKLPGFKED